MGGTVGRVLRGGVRPVEIGHGIVREMGDGRSVGVRGQPVVPNHFQVTLATQDLERFAEVKDSLVKELCDVARDHARDEGWTFMGPVRVELASDERLRGGAIKVLARMKEADGGGWGVAFADGRTSCARRVSRHLGPPARMHDLV